MMFYAVVFVIALLSIIVQYFVPSVPWLYGAQLSIVSLVVFYAAIAFPLPLALLLCSVCGLLWDMLTVLVVNGELDRPLAWTAVHYGVITIVIQLLNSSEKPDKWTAHCLLCGFGTLFILTMGYLYITLQRGGMFFPLLLWWKVLWSAILSSIFAPLAYLILEYARKQFNPVKSRIIS